MKYLKYLFGGKWQIAHCLRRHGGLFSRRRGMSPAIGILQKQFIELLEVNRRDKSYGPAFKGIYCEVIDNSAFNAFAFEPTNRAIIGLYAGAAAEVFLFSLVLFSHPFFLPDVGEASGENPTYEPLKPQFPDIDRKILSKEIMRVLVHMMVTSSSQHLSFFQPKTDSRTACAYLVAARAIHFIFLHELSHILLGHCRYLSSRFGLKEFFELGISNKSHVPLKLLHLFETQADTLASILFREWFDKGEYRNIPSVDRSWIKELNYVGCLLAFWIMGSRQSDVTEELFKTDHPHPTVRTHNISHYSALGVLDWTDGCMKAGGALSEAFLRLGRDIVPYEAVTESLAHKVVVTDFSFDVNKELKKLARYPEGLDHVRI